MKNRSRVNRCSVRGAAISVALTVGLWANQAGAQMIVNDPKNTVESMKQLQEMKRSYDKLNDQYKELQKQFNQQLVNGMSYVGRDGVKVKLDRRPLGYGVMERCTDIKNPGPKQKELCTALVQTQNRQFNAMVDLQELTEAREGELKDVYKERAGIKPDEAGRLQANNNRLLSFQARTQVDLQNAQNILEAYGGQVRVLEQEHSKAAQAVIEGEQTGSKIDLKKLAQGGMRAAALKAAFEVAKRRER
ncbi:MULTISPECIES: hypothetical protein [unclassified Lysobacter]|uniref:hypothetical protein n=1 Tax=unclassified Lysobacter TaxID=2635362 RepID=UPI001BE7640F|nr:MULTISPECIES: hypothetical protein [unclassified Lysobacter]MBT2748311.1 hypothetical protein [Lysobacter sp. ISL-42]MBT2749922.1 hypothetical protein [Lysobacter sp. ISL-50]MBT2781250.1 hypothetical protein [Lysobacter sp. ISL-52]